MSNPSPTNPSPTTPSQANPFGDRPAPPFQRSTPPGKVLAILASIFGMLAIVCCGGFGSLTWYFIKNVQSQHTQYSFHPQSSLEEDLRDFDRALVKKFNEDVPTTVSSPEEQMLVSQINRHLSQLEAGDDFQVDSGAFEAAVFSQLDPQQLSVVRYLRAKSYFANNSPTFWLNSVVAYFFSTTP